MNAQNAFGMTRQKKKGSRNGRPSCREETARYANQVRRDRLILRRAERTDHGPVS